MPSIDTLVATASALSRSPAWLAFGEEPVSVSGQTARSARFAQRLGRLREAQGHGRKTLAKITKLSDTTVRACEASAVMPTLATVEKLARALKGRPSWLTFGPGGGPTFLLPARDPNALGEGQHSASPF